MKPAEIRKAYLDFFANREHSVVKSDLLVPSKDPTLLFTTAGMVQFKLLYAGAPLPYARATSVQKCLRAGGKGSDLERVGQTLRHHTFFEMLGNFSFGDYFKTEAIQYALEFIRDVLKMDEDHLWVSVYEEDDEARELWIQAGFPADRIKALGKEDNFWGPAGDEGACGPCSEIYYDLGPDHSCGRPECAVGCDCERYLEFWNLVFPQYYQEKDGSRKPLARRGVDTGMGLERLAFLMDEGAEDNYQTDLFKPILQKLQEMAPKPYESARSHYHVVADHIRALTFAIGDGVLPSNEGRGYVIRRILRRALRFGRGLGLEKPFLHTCVPVVVELFGEAYSDLKQNSPTVIQVIRDEEERFIQTLSRGMIQMETLFQELRDQHQTILQGDACFRLYDTWGLPLEMIQEVAEEQGFQVDLDGFEAAMQSQKERGKASWKGTAYTLPQVMEQLGEQASATCFTGYEEQESNSVIVALFHGDKKVDFLTVGQEGFLVVDKTPCYAESGGQVGDQGYCHHEGGQALITDVQKTKDDIFLHALRVTEGKLSVGDPIHLGHDAVLRAEIKKHHTATHLLQAVLRDTLGKHVKQAGSYVGPDRLRFDFSHPHKVNAQEIKSIEQQINQWILKDESLQVKTLSLVEAKKDEKILANFGEKYGDTVRVIAIGEGSKELCGGTHVDHAGEIGGFQIVSEGSVASGVRRIEAVVGKAYQQRNQDMVDRLRELCLEMKVPAEGVLEKFQSQTLKIRNLEKRIKELLTSGGGSQTPVFNFEQESDEIQLRVQGFDNTSGKDLMGILDGYKSRYPRLISCLAAVEEGKVQYLVACQGTDRIHSGSWLQTIVTVAEGKGGGRQEMARGGSKKPDLLVASLEKARDSLLEKFSQ